MGILIDSDIIIDLLNNQNSAINFFKDTTISKEIFISIISWAEVVYGFKKNKSFNKEKLFQDFLEDYKVITISIDKMVAEKYLDVKIDLEAKRIPLDDFDLFIAATAMFNNLTLATRNTKHFKRIKKLQLFTYPQL